MDADYEYLQSIGYREVGQLLIGVMITGISYVYRQEGRQVNYSRLAFLPFDTLTLEVSRGCPGNLLAEIESDAKTIIARRGERYQLSPSQYVILGGT